MTDSESGSTGSDADAGADGAAGEESAGPGSAAEERRAVVLDVLPHGRPDDDRPQYQKEPIAYAVAEDDFRLFELTLAEDADVSIDDRVVVEPAGARESVTALREIDYDELSRGANQELEYVVEEIIDRHERRFVDFYNEAQPITLRLHQLNLLPGIGKKLRNKILDERKRQPFAEFEELDGRVAGLHDPKGVIVERIMEELRDEDLKYKTFVGRPNQGRGE